MKNAINARKNVLVIVFEERCQGKLDHLQDLGEISFTNQSTCTCIHNISVPYMILHKAEGDQLNYS